MGFAIFIGCFLLFVIWATWALIKESNGPYTRYWTSRVRVPATWHDEYVSVTSRVADFRLGEGPCGLTVTQIYCGWTEGGKNFYVKQKCSNGESKTFTYRREDITGRIEETTHSELVDQRKEK